MCRFLLILLVLASSVLRGELRDPLSSVHRRSSKPVHLEATLSHAEKHQQLVVLDPGHGGPDEGTKLSSLHEKRIALTTALLTKRHLEEMGYRVILTRSRDIFIPLPQRAQMANDLEANLFVSIHYNSSRNPEAKGIEVFYHNSGEQGRQRLSHKLADCVLHHLVDETEARSRGVKRGNFLVIRETKMPAILVEAGFLTNYEEFEKLKKRQYLDQVAKGIALGVEQFLN